MAESTRKKKKDGLVLNSTQKLAAFLIIMGEDAAAEIVKKFDDNERELVCAEMANLPSLDAVQQGAVLQEFTSMAIEAQSGVSGNVEFTRKVLEKAIGLFKAAEVIGRVGTARTSVTSMQQIIDLDALAICNLLKEEDPQTVALVVSYLSAAKGSEVLMSLPEKERELVVEKLATLESTPIEVVETLGEVLSAKVGERVSRALNQTGGEKSAAAVLKAMDKEDRQKLLNNLDERTPELVRSIRISAATDSLKDSMLGSLSKRAAENVKEEIDNLGKVSLREIELSQNSIVDVVRQLETEGEISLEGE
jgi:flagellar motor switch protein FliG